MGEPRGDHRPLTNDSERGMPPPRRTYRALWAGWLILGAGGLMLVGLAVIPARFPAAGARLANLLRAVVGPGPVARLEGAAYKIQDAYNRLRYRLTGGQPQFAWASDGAARTEVPPEEPAATPTELPSLASSATPSPAPAGTRTSSLVRPTRRASPTPTSRLRRGPSPAGKARGSPTPSPSCTPGATATTVPSPAMTAPPAQPTPIMAMRLRTSSVVHAPPDVEGGWQAFGPFLAGRAVIARAAVRPDPSRPYAVAALVRLDLARTRLHLVPGSVEPRADQGVLAFPRPGTIPRADQSPQKLLAAFNGGFQAVHGRYGMMVDGLTIVTPTDGAATLALLVDGSVCLGEWGRDILPEPDVAAYRQNCPLLIDRGALNPAVKSDDRQSWGLTLTNLDTTWRSGVGLSQDGRYLVYAAGGSLTVGALARALQMGGAYDAMQLDINPFYTCFVTFRPAPPGSGGRFAVVAEKLLVQMPGGPTQFLTPYEHDFFYVTAAPGAGMVTAP